MALLDDRSQKTKITMALRFFIYRRYRRISPSPLSAIQTASTPRAI